MTPQRKEHTKMSSSRVRILLLSMLAVFAVSAAAASTASAKHVWTFEGKPLPVGTTKTLEVVKSGNTILTAGTEVVECKKQALVADTIENIEAENLKKEKGKTGRDKGTIKFTECKNPKPCTVTEPIEVKNGVTALVEGSTSKKVYDVFEPEGWTEPKTPEEAKKLKTFVTIHQTGTGCITATAVESNGVAAEVSPGTEAAEQTFKFPGEHAGCEPKGKPLTPINWWNGLNETALSLKAFGAKAEECGSVMVKLSTGGKWGVE
jgi:hypothetical protein